MKYASVTLSENILIHQRMLNKVIDVNREKDDVVLEDSQYGILYKVSGKPTALIPWPKVKVAMEFPSKASEKKAVKNQLEGKDPPAKSTKKNPFK